MSSYEKMGDILKQVNNLLSQEIGNREYKESSRRSENRWQIIVDFGLRPSASPVRLTPFGWRAGRSEHWDLMFFTYILMSERDNKLA